MTTHTTTRGLIEPSESTWNRIRSTETVYHDMTSSVASRPGAH
jgi:hypothetical protein